ncbi:hypothetical protein [Paenibacillus mucilaginosus]|uniref:hypothetical protein n=1 Tax=Paenibacillus mucilaginosus TaxID=61624 RepID=UPI003D1A5526
MKTGMTGDSFTLPASLMTNAEIEALIKTFISDRLMFTDASLRVNDQNSITIKGTSNLNTASLEVFLSNENPAFTLVVSTPDLTKLPFITSWLSSIFSIFDSNYTLTNSAIVVSSSDNSPFPSNLLSISGHSDTINTGCYLSALLDVEGPPFNLLQGIFGKITPLELMTQLQAGTFSGPIITNLSVNPSPIGSIRISNSRMIIMADSIQFRTLLSLEIQKDTLVFDGGGTLRPGGSFDIIFALKEVKKSDQESIESTGWTDPFGFSGFTIRELGVGITLGASGTELSLAGEIALGDDGSSEQIIMEVGTKFTNGQLPSALLASVRSSAESTEGIPLSRFVEFFTRIPIGNFVLLNQVKIKNLTLYIVADPNGFRPPTEPEKTYHGLSMSAELSLLRVSCKALLEFQQNKGIKVQGELGIIELGGVLRITDETGTKGPFLIIDTTQTNEWIEKHGYIHLSSKVDLFGVSQSVSIKAAEKTFEYVLGYNIKGFANFDLACRLSGTDIFKGYAEVNFNFTGKNITLKAFGQTVASVHLGQQVKGLLEVSLAAQAFNLSLKAVLELPGLPKLDVEIKYNEAISDLLELPEEVFESIVNKVEETYKDALEDPVALLNLAGKSGVNFVKQTGELLKDLYKKGANEVAKLLLSINFDPAESVRMLLVDFQINRDQLGSFLKDTGFPASATALFLKNGLNLSLDSTAASVLNLGYPLNEAAIGLHNIGVDGEILSNQLSIHARPINDIVVGLHALNWTPEQMTVKLKQLNNLNYQIAKSLKDTLGLNEINVTQALKSAFNIKEVAGALAISLDVKPENMAEILKVSGYSIPDIAVGVKISVSRNLGHVSNDNFIKILESNQVAKALKTQFNDLDSISTGIKSVYSLSNESLARIFHVCKFDPKDIASYANNHWNWDASKVGGFFTESLGINQDEVISFLEKAGFSGEAINKFKVEIPKPGGTFGEIVDRFPRVPF